MEFKAFDKKSKVMYDKVLCIDFTGVIIRKGYPSIIVKEDDGCVSLEDVILLKSTGVLDKSGKEIYHGDIVKNGDDLFVCENVLTELGYMTQFTGKFKNKFGEMIEWQLGGASMDDIEIVGNIYENPEII